MFKAEYSQPGLYGPSTVYIREFEGMGELAECAERINADPSAKDNASRRLSYDFTGTKSLGEAVDLAHYGWPEGLARVTEELEQIDSTSLTGPSVRTDMLWDVHGDEPDVGAFLSGDPENMIRFEPAISPQGSTVELLFNAGYDKEVSRADVIANGAGMLAVIDCLQTGGYSVGLTATSATLASGTSTHDKIEYRVPILKPGEYMDKDALSFALMHPSFLRRLILAAEESESTFIRRRMGFYSENHYGYPLDEYLYVPPADHLILGVRGRVNDRTSSQQQAQKLLDQVVELCNKHEEGKLNT